MNNPSSIFILMILIGIIILALVFIHSAFEKKYENETTVNKQISNTENNNKEEVDEEKSIDTIDNIFENTAEDNKEANDKLVLFIDEDGVYHLDAGKLNLLKKKDPETETLNNKNVAVHGIISDIQYDTDSDGIEHIGITVESENGHGYFNIWIYDKNYTPNYNDRVAIYGVYEHTNVIFTQAVQSCYKVEIFDNQNNVIETYTLNPDAIYEQVEAIEDAEKKETIEKYGEQYTDDNGILHVNINTLDKDKLYELDGKKIALTSKISSCNQSAWNGEILSENYQYVICTDASDPYAGLVSKTNVTLISDERPYIIIEFAVKEDFVFAKMLGNHGIFDGDEIRLEVYGTYSDESIMDKISDVYRVDVVDNNNNVLDTWTLK